MCGICGIWFKGNGDRPTVELLREMTDTLAHRGPDEEGQEIVSDLGFGHRRLRIIDLATGQQPMCNEDGTVWVVFNGEIYNFVELREGLVLRGHRFKSRCDTEVLVHLYEEYGQGMAEKLRGMFAFALWDDRRRELLLCRDRLGIKPLYFCDNERFTAFSSELKTLLPLFSKPPELIPEAISDYFSFGYVPSPLTPFRGIQKLAPAHRALISREGSTLESYWTPLDQVPQEQGDPEQRLAELVDEAVRIRLVSDVDFGAFLSGGVDSSTVCAMMQRHLTGLRTFSIGFPVGAYDELPHAGEVARHLGTEHHTRVVQPDAVALLPKLAWHFDEPLADSSAIPMWYLSELARSHVTMVHSGDGGDELFGGYERYQNELKLQSLTRLFGTGTFRLGELLLKALDCRGNPANRLLRILSRAQLEPVARYRSGVGIFVNGFESVLNQRFRELSSGFFERAFEQGEFNGSSVTLRSLGLVDLKTYLPEDVLTKVDRMTMAHSLEARVPLLDHKLVEFAFSLPDRFRADPKGGGKRVLKELAATLVPRQVIYRPKKGFAVPLAEWFRGALHQMMADLQSSPNHPSFAYVERGFVQKMVADHASGRFDHAERLWSLLMFQNWMELYVARPRDPYAGIMALWN